MNSPSAPAQPLRPRRRHPWRDTIEGILSALALVLIIRHFAFEVFKIPTGSMAPTLLGQHRDVVCPNCGYPYILDNGEGTIAQYDARCPNCWYQLTLAEIQRDYCSCFPAWPPRLFWRGGNRVIVNKFLPQIRPVGRWDIVVFKYPYVLVHCKRCADVTRVPQDRPLPTQCPDCGGPVTYERQNFIKRLVGLPGDELLVRHGDIYINGQIQRKPPDVQEAVWQHVYDSRYQAKEPVRDDLTSPDGSIPLTPCWKAETGRYEVKGAQLDLIPVGNSPARLRYAAPITDYPAYNHWPPNERLFPVGDMRWSVEARLDAPGLLRLGIEEDDQTFTAAIRFGNASGQTSLNLGGKSVAKSDFTAEPGRTVCISFANADDRLELRADGRLLCSYDITAPLAGDPDRARSNGAWLEADGAPVDFDRVRLQRDLYYLSSGVDGSRDGYHVPAGNYFVMGDNTRNSADSRSWGPFPKENLIGIGSVVWWPLNQIRPCR